MLGDRLLRVHVPATYHPAVGASEADERRLRRAPVRAQVVHQVREIGHGLLCGEEVHAALRAGTEGYAGPVVAVFSEYQQCLEFRRRLPHKSRVVDIKLHIVFIAKVEKNRTPTRLIPPLIVDEEPLFEGRVTRITQWRGLTFGTGV